VIPPGPFDRVVLIGFMGSGKSAVGPLLAEALGWSFYDSDTVIEAASGTSVTEQFARYGEAEFRASEAQVMHDLLSASNVVVASGGGWAAQPGALDGAPPGTLSVWLAVTPETAVGRVAQAGGGRPLLDVPNPVAAATKLLAEREASYARSDLAYDTESLTSTEIVAQIVHVVKSNKPRSR
jgi:shikimate kinase